MGKGKWKERAAEANLECIGLENRILDLEEYVENLHEYAEQLEYEVDLYCSEHERIKKQLQITEDDLEFNEDDCEDDCRDCDDFNCVPEHPNCRAYYADYAAFVEHKLPKEVCPYCGDVDCPTYEKFKGTGKTG